MRCDALRKATGLALCLGVLSLALLVSGCASEVGAPPGQGSGQRQFKIALLADDAALDRGVLSYQVPATLVTGSSAALSVEVLDAGQGSGGTTPPPVPAGWVTAPQDVPTGGIVGVTASCQGLTCDAESPERQPVLAFDQTGSWQWTVSAQSPGTATIRLTAITYDQDTDIALHVTQPIEITVKVTASLGYWASQVGHWVAGLLGFVGFAAIVTAAQWAWRRRRKRKTTAKTGAEEQTAPTPASADSAPPAPVDSAPPASIDAAASDPASTAQTPDDH
jgi:hypothetical protein